MSNYKTSLAQATDYIIATAKKMAKDKKYGEPVMLHSSPGVGKSANVHQVGEIIKEMFEEAFNAKFKIWDVRVGAQDESGIQGIPYPTTVDIVDGVEIKDMMFSTPMWFPREGECGILFLDEISNAAIPNQQAAYRLVHDRSIHNGTTLPEGVIVIGAGNLKEDKTGAKGLIPALARRFKAHFYIEPNVEDFTAYAIKKRLHSAVIGFLNYDTSKLVGKAIEGEFGFACPANWESVSGDLNNEFMDQRMKETGIVSCLGSAVGQEFVGFLRNEKWLPDYNKVEKEGEYSLPNDAETDRAIKFTIVSSTSVRILNNMDDGVDPELTDNLAEILNKFDPSTAGIAFRAMRRTDQKSLNNIISGKYPKLRSLLTSVVDRASSLQ